MRLSYASRAAQASLALMKRPLPPLPASTLRPRSSAVSIAKPTARTLLTDSLPSVLVPPVVFTTLLLGLWTYKCVMTVIFQDKIIYMPYMPPFARHEKMEDYTTICRPVEWSRTHINSLDGTSIALCIGRLSRSACQVPAANLGAIKRIVICYFQGNGSSPPPRMPVLSKTLEAIQSRATAHSSGVEYIVVALSYRGYWTSSGRASQRGIEKDAQALLQWISKEYSALDVDLQIVLWGQSIGAAVAATAAADYVASAGYRHPIKALILETPFSSIKSMLTTLYPQRWLPYKYLWPFLWNHWDNEAALKRLATSGHSPPILIMPAAKDEVVPPEEANKIERNCLDAGLKVQRKDIVGALHTEATSKRDGQLAIAKFVREVTG